MLNRKKEAKARKAEKKANPPAERKTFKKPHGGQQTGDFDMQKWWERALGQLNALVHETEKMTCGCGREYIVCGYDLLSGRVTCCGDCEPNHRALPVRMLNPTELPEFMAYYHMVSSCYYPKHPKYAENGAKGIKVCSGWLDNFPKFLADMGCPPSDEFDPQIEPARSIE